MQGLLLSLPEIGAGPKDKVTDMLKSWLGHPNEETIPSFFNGILYPCGIPPSLPLSFSLSVWSINVPLGK